MIRAGFVGRAGLACDDSSWDVKNQNMISHIFLSFNEIVTSIQFGYLENGSLVLSKMFGKSERNFRVVKLNQDEYITGLTGVVGEFGGIRNLTFHTNHDKHGPIGCLRDDPELRLKKTEIDPAISDRSEFGGFFGTQHKHRLKSIGIYLKPIASSSHTVVKREKS